MKKINMNSVAETAGYVGQERRVNFAFTFKGGGQKGARETAGKFLS